ncbi:MAG: GH32 C-terminal domain-containing protein [Clostridiales bacterium]|nr:GH32 C-terminal domain-containing protein [Clostridiales bacterium]
MRRKVLSVLLVCAVLVVALSGCDTATTDGDSEENLLLYLTFDEGSGTAITDASGNLPDGELNYVYTNALYMDSQDPQWRTSAVYGGALLFDGSSTSVTYSKSDLQVEGSTFSISVWFAPRTFEWDDPYAEENGTQLITGIISQCSTNNCTGFQLGYQRYGKLCFEVGTGEEWLTLWGDANLEKYEWNYVTAVFDGENGLMSLYLNGECVGSMEIEQGSAIAAANRQLIVGRTCEAEQMSVGYINMCSGLMVSPTDDLHDLETEVLIDETDLTAEEADALLQEVNGDMLYIRVTFTDIQAEEFGVSLLESGDGSEVTSYFYSTTDGLIHGETTNRGAGSTTGTVSGALTLEDGSLTMEIYLDRSLVEGFFNDTKAISMRAYPEGEDSDGLSLLAEGGSVTVAELYVAEMGSIYE